MSFDQNSLERLRQLGRQLPQPIKPPISSSQIKPQTSSKLHAIETEEDPNNLFRELMNASPDGSVPPHLINRLKKTELKQQEQTQKERISHLIAEDKQLQPPLPKIHQTQGGLQKKSQHKTNPIKETLYVDFERLLLEDEDEI
ncbi:hypothetical protein [Prochlorococcus sp. MIT 1300]|uniref:hypothetical protein n=1 Tax=Prochlorococcus sp. MIT 1300 TaxID=3096218 RepID=UPI002A752F51|nr:hypothetical protein [Prochlorococcus sp. MIT 1300]